MKDNHFVDLKLEEIKAYNDKIQERIELLINESLLAFKKKPKNLREFEVYKNNFFNHGKEIRKELKVLESMKIKT